MIQKNRLEAFSDGVIAIIITIMVLELKVPHGANWAALQKLSPIFWSYVLSFVYTGIYWNNHHHMLHLVHKVTGSVLWANLHLLFWLSLIPFATGWMGENHFAPLPVAIYGAVLLMSAVAFSILSHLLVAIEGRDSDLGLAFQRDWKGNCSIVLYALAIGCTFINRWISVALYVLVSLMWLVPDRRVERVVERKTQSDTH
jgi:uncharacterized membrane protein